MLKNKNLLKIGSLISVMMLVIGIVLCTIGYSMEGNIDYLKTNKHQWYRIIYVNQIDELNLGVSFDNHGVFGHIEIPLGE